MTYGPITAGGSAEQTYIVTAGPETPPGHSASFLLDISASLGIAASGEFYLVIGQIPVLVIDMDGNNNSSTEMMVCLDNLSVGADMVDAWPDDMNLYSSIFVCLGIYPENYTLTDSEGQELADYLDAGGRIYMEGGDTWFYDQPTPVHAMFNIQGLEDGSDDLGTILGQEGAFTNGLIYNYDGDVNWIDHIAPMGDAFTIFKNQSPVYATAVAYDEGTYRTIGSSFEFGGLEDGDNSKEYLMHKYLEFFGIESIWVSVPEEVDGNVVMGRVYPNPFTNETNISLTLSEDADLRIEVYNINGQMINSLQDSKLAAGTHIIRWNAQADGASEGIYFFRIISDNDVITKKVIMMR